MRSADDDALAGRIPERKQPFYVSRAKRLFDLMLASVLLLFTLPLLVLLVVLNLLFAGWPPFYTGRRIGQNGKPFRIIKLRTMVKSAESFVESPGWIKNGISDEYLRNFKLSADPRVTKLGTFLRQTSLDELPQLFNVLKGDMSMVGPRPLQALELALHYGQASSQLLSVKPGLTGRWQATGRSGITYPERCSVELAYVEQVSFGSDVRILCRTIPSVLLRRGTA